MKTCELKVSLVGHLVGSVPITNISTDFTNRLRPAAEVTEHDASDHDLPSLDKLYKVGDIVAAAAVKADLILFYHCHPTEQWPESMQKLSV